MTPSDSAASPAIFASAEQFRFLADMIPQLVWITDPTGYHIHFNQRWIDFTGYTLADSVGPDMWNNLLHPDDQQRARQVWGHALATGADYEIEYRFKAQDGSYRWFLGSARPLRDAEGRITTWFGTCTDIQQQIELREQLERAYADLEAKVTFRTLDLEHQVQELKQRLGE
ncbi:PAS domain-containing protein [uncultured Hymenobacter sp.]|uniref:PAS domain-containing protein n=1 Tax=uncultured Hymenobacter sp. TaxID=170016 RepID=UPI0035C9E8E3